MKDKATQEQLNELKRLSEIARVPDESETVTSKEEAEVRIRDLKEKLALSKSSTSSVCFGIGWVCENHLSRASSEELWLAVWRRHALRVP
jgi:hypothetical protein